MAPKKATDPIAEIEAENARTRDEFAATLDAIEAKLNPVNQAKRAVGGLSKLVERGKRAVSGDKD